MELRRFDGTSDWSAPARVIEIAAVQRVPVAGGWPGIVGFVVGVLALLALALGAHA